jgi:hypothetical protein
VIDPHDASNGDWDSLAVPELVAVSSKRNVGATIPQPSTRREGGLRTFHRGVMLDIVQFVSAETREEIDPVLLTMLAVNRLGPATIRTATSGKAQTIAVADERIARIFRAALDEMQKTRCTDRLVDIVVAPQPA